MSHLTTTAQVIPFSPRDSGPERALAAGLAMEAHIWPAVRDVLTEDDFADRHCRAVWRACCALDADGLAVELVGITSRMTDERRVETPGSWLDAAIEAHPSFARWESWVEQIRRASMARKAAAQSQETARRVAAEANPSDALAEAAERFGELRAQLAGPGRTDAAACADDFDAALDEAKRRRSLGLAAGLASGIRALDDLTNGLRPGDLVVVAARPRVGKTVLAMQWVATACRAGTRAVVFSLEMPRAQLMQRMAAQLSGVPFGLIRDGALHPSDEEAVTEAIREVRTSWPLDIDDRSALLNTEIYATCGAYSRRGPPIGLVVVDYLQLVRARVHKNGNRENEVASISRSMKALAKDLKCPVVVLSQLNREGEKTNRPPMLSDLRESGAIEQDADMVMFLHRRLGENGTDLMPETKLMLSKHRNGPCGRIDLRYQGEKVRFVE